MSIEDPRESSDDPMDILCWLMERGYTVAFRGVYKQSAFHVRAVRGESVLIREGRELRALMKDLRREAKQNAQTESPNR